MSANGNSKLMNSLLPLNSKNSNSWFTPASNSSNSTTGTSSMTAIIVFVVVVVLVVGAMYYYKNQISDTWTNAKDIVKGYFYPPPPPPPPVDPKDQKNPKGPAGPAEDGHNEVTNASVNDNSPTPSSVVDKILPGTEVFNVSSNRYTYYDAEPLCKALGAELATYDQVKEAWGKGADWCNYGWVKGQMAVYPTSEETYQKLQGGPEDQRQACGRPGMNGGFFDNPEMRFGVTCVGNKPPQNKHDEAQAAKGAPLSPDALAFDKKVSQFKSEASHIGLLPFNPSKWTS